MLIYISIFSAKLSCAVVCLVNVTKADQLRQMYLLLYRSLKSHNNVKPSEVDSICQVKLFYCTIRVQLLHTHLQKELSVALFQ